MESLIRNYGLFWDREKVGWGRPKVSGTLHGVHSKGKKDGKVDFREQIGIYALYDASFNVLYIGQAGGGNQHLYKRLNDHQKDHLSQRWKYFSWFGLRWVTGQNKLSSSASGVLVKSQIALDHLEAISIAIAEPKLNLQRGKFGDDCEQYFQFSTSDEIELLEEEQ